MMDNRMPRTADPDQITFKVSMARKVSRVALRSTSEVMPMPKSAAATSRVAMGSISENPKVVMIHRGATNNGTANTMSAMKWATNQYRRRSGTTETILDERETDVEHESRWVVWAPKAK